MRPLSMFPNVLAKIFGTKADRYIKALQPLKEAINGVVTHTYFPKLSPVEEYLRLQGRFRHLFEPTVQKEAIAHIQGRVHAYWERVNLAERTG